MDKRLSDRPRLDDTTAGALPDDGSPVTRPRWTMTGQPAAGARCAASPSIFGKEWSTPAVTETLLRQNKPDGFMCVSCAWAKPADHHTFEFCENGAKATLWELTTRRCTPDFFAEHTRDANCAAGTTTTSSSRAG